MRTNPFIRTIKAITFRNHEIDGNEYIISEYQKGNFNKEINDADVEIISATNGINLHQKAVNELQEKCRDDIIVYYGAIDNGHCYRCVGCKRFFKTSELIKHTKVLDLSNDINFDKSFNKIRRYTEKITANQKSMSSEELFDRLNEFTKQANNDKNRTKSKNKYKPN